MNSCLCEHQVLSARSWPVTALEMDLPARLTVCCSAQGRNMLSYILLECEFPASVVPVIIVSVFFGKYRREYPAHSMCFAMTASQHRQRWKSSTFILEWLRSSDRPSHPVSQASGEATRNCWRPGTRNRVADSIRRARSGATEPRDTVRQSNAIPRLLLPPAGKERNCL